MRFYLLALTGLLAAWVAALYAADHGLAVPVALVAVGCGLLALRTERPSR